MLNQKSFLKAHYERNNRNSKREQCGSNWGEKHNFIARESRASVALIIHPVKQIVVPEQRNRETERERAKVNGDSSH